MFSEDQKRGVEKDLTPLMEAISFKALRIVASLVVSSFNNNVDAVDFMRGIALKKIRRAMMIEATGSNPCHEKKRVRMVRMTTPTEPSVSARMCRNMPLMLSFMLESQDPDSMLSGCEVEV